LKEVKRCTQKGIVINTFMLDRNYYLKEFVNQVAKINKGRVFYTTPDKLGQYILVDYVASKRKKIGGQWAVFDVVRAPLPTEGSKHSGGGLTVAVGSTPACCLMVRRGRTRIVRQAARRAVQLLPSVAGQAARSTRRQ
jgi:hypothetical protein